MTGSARDSLKRFIILSIKADEKLPLTIPNLLTVARICLIPFFIVSYLLFEGDRGHFITTGIFVIAALTDALDGYLARKLQVTSPFGAFLDPIADKLMVCTALILLVSDTTVLENVLVKGTFVFAAIVIVGREVSVAALREWMAEIGTQTRISSSWMAKVKTVAQMLAIVFLLIGDPIEAISCRLIGELLLYVAVLLTLWTMYVYIRTAWPTLVAENSD